MQSTAQPTGQDSTQGQITQHSIPPAPTFASLGAHSMPFTGSLGSLASGHQQPPQQTVQGKEDNPNYKVLLTRTLTIITPLMQ